MITRIEATQYRCFERLGIDLGPYGVVVGANGAGKTTLLDVPVLLGDMLKARDVNLAFLEAIPPRGLRASNLGELIYQGWQDNPEVAHALRFRGASLRALLQETGEWPAAAAKPAEPRETIQRLIRENRAAKTKVVYSRIARSVATRHCKDGAFLELTATLCEWFRPEDA